MPFNSNVGNPFGSGSSGGGGGAVDSVNGQTGTVVLTKSDVGLGNVDNTTDANKPVSTATQNALNDKVTGPASVTADDVVQFDSTTGKLVKSGGALTTAGKALISAANAAAQRTALSVYSTTEVDNLDEFESKEISGVVTITPKAAYSTDEFRIGTAVTTYQTLAADFVYADVEISKSKISAASSDATLIVGTVGATYDDNDNNFASVNVGGQNDTWVWEFTPNQVFTKFSLNQYSNPGDGYKISSIKLEYHDGSNYQTIFANQSCTAPHHTFEDFVFPTPVIGEKIRMTVLTCGQDGNNERYAIYEVNFYGAEYLTTPNLVPTGTLNFAPASLVVKDGNGDVINTLDGTAYKIAFKKTIAGNTTDYATEENPSVFIARDISQFAACQALYLRVFPISNQSISSISIENTSSSITVKPSGEIVAEIDGIEVWKTTADGDATQVDTTVASLTATGAVSGASVTGATVSATTSATLANQSLTKATVTTTDATQTTLASISVPADKITTVRMTILANKAATADKNRYIVEGTFYRNGSGNVTQLGDLISLDTNESATAWDATMVANTGTQAIDIKVTGANATTVVWTGAFTTVEG